MHYIGDCSGDERSSDAPFKRRCRGMNYTQCHVIDDPKRY